MIGIQKGSAIVFGVWMAINAALGNSTSIPFQERPNHIVSPIARLPKVRKDSLVLRRMSLFLGDLAAALPNRLKEFDRITTDGRIDYGLQLERSNFRSDVIRLNELGCPKDLQRGDCGLSNVGGKGAPSLPSASVWLDSLSQRWVLIGDEARSVWLFQASGGMRMQLTPVLVELSTEPILRPHIQQLSTRLLESAHQTKNTETANGLAASAYVLRGSVALQQGDSSTALRAFLDAARIPRAFMGHWAVRKAVVLSAAVHDTASWMAALTLRKLVNGEVDSTSRAADGLLRSLYEAYVYRFNQTPPDVVPQQLQGDLLPRRPLSFDAFLDRQWMGLYDRGFPTARLRPQPTIPLSQPSRLVVVEYWTGINCSGCWVKDLGLQPLTRRYSSDQVIPLAYHNGPPITGGVEPFFDWLGVWYGVNVGRAEGIGNRRAGLNVKLSAEERGEIGPWVDGKLLARSEYERTHFLPELLYRRSVDRVDRELRRAPEAQLRLSAQERHNRVQVVADIDSLSGSHSHLVLRLALFEDTVWVHNGTTRRIYQNVVRGVANDDTLTLGVAIPQRAPASISYVFNLTAIQDSISCIRDPAYYVKSENMTREEAERRVVFMGKDQYDDRDFVMNRSRLHVVAFIQDRDTGEVLQAAQVKVNR